ncbi:MAG: hypothetical protein KAI16_00645 [Candidatus Pacebacteria bacterium]|nr:hypothetical protein [Candidatus Paceibacterota bacterium]
MLKSLVIKLKKQHRDIEKKIADISLELKKDEWDYENISKLLFSLKNDIAEHLKLENEEFYPNFIKILVNSGGSAGGVEGFMKQMDFVLSRINTFFIFFDTEEKIKCSDKDIFKFEFSRIMSELETRLNVEEYFVYKRALNYEV